MPEENVRAMWSEDELDQALAALGTPDAPDDRSFHRARAELLVAAGAAAPEPEARAPRRRGWWAAAVGTAAMIVAVVLVVQTVRSDGDLPTTAAARSLNLAADKISTPDEPLRPGEYRYIARRALSVVSSQKSSYRAMVLDETWVPADEKQEWLWRRSVTDVQKWVGGTWVESPQKEDESIFVPRGEYRAPCGDWVADRPCSAKGNWQSPNVEFMASLPRDPDQLFNLVQSDLAERGEHDGIDIVVTVAGLLQTGVAPADLRAALYRVLADVPGLQVTEQYANLDGMKGTAYGMSQADGYHYELIVDTATGQYIGDRSILENGLHDLPPGTVFGHSSVTTTIVTGLGVEPVK
jgi:hypothetical protein